MKKNIKIYEGIDHNLVYDFFSCFSRFEYALKRSRYFDPKKNYPSPNWEIFSEKYEEKLKIIENVDFIESIEYLKNNRPKKQELKDGNLVWKNNNTIDDYKLSSIINDVKRIRNNLFHGGKFSSGLEMDVIRDAHLLKCSLIILMECLNFDDSVKHYFYEGTDY